MNTMILTNLNFVTKGTHITANVKVNIIKRCHGNRNIGHIHKIMNAISKNKNLPASSTTLSFTPKSQNTTPNLSPTDVPQTCDTNSSQITSIAKNLGIEKIAKESVTRSRAQIAQKSNEALDIYFQKNQRALEDFCNHFKDIPLNELLKDPVFISYFVKLIEKKPYLLSRPFALSFEVSYDKRFFDPKVLASNNITINNPFDLPNVKIDQSTLYTFLVSNFILNSSSPFENISNISINPTPSGRFNIEEFSPMLQSKALLNKNLTGNVTNDFDFCGHPYDLKHVSSISLNKNQIYIVDLEIFNQIAPNYFINLPKIINDKLRNNSFDFSQDEKEFFKRCCDELYTLNNSSLNFSDKLEIWNNFIVMTMSKRPLNCTIPIIALSTKEPFLHDPKATYNTMENVPRKKKLEPNEVQETIVGNLEKHKYMAEAAKKSTLGKIDVEKTTSNTSEEVD